jgi:methyl-accepting chemotaxis protein
MNLRARTYLTFLGLALLSAAAVGFLAYFSVMMSVERDARARLAGIATTYRDGIDEDVAHGTLTDERVRTVLTDRSALGESGEITVVAHDPDGGLTLVSPRRFSAAFSVPRKLVPAALTGPESMGALTQDAFKSGITDYRGRNVFAASVFDPTTHWGFVAKMDEDEALQPYRSMLPGALALGLLFAVTVACLFAFLYLRAFIDPLRRLTRAVVAISAGDTRARLDPGLKTANGEVGELARALDRASISMKLALNPQIEPFDADQKVKVDFDL